MLGIDSWHQTQIIQEDYLIVEAFCQGFEQAHTRFLDLNKAEAQARETQNTTSPGKVRIMNDGYATQ